MSARLPSSLLFLVCALAGCGRLRFDDVPPDRELDAGAPYDAESTPVVALDASVQDVATLPARDGDTQPLDSSLSDDAGMVELDARGEDASAVDAASCPPGTTGPTCASCVRYVDRNSAAVLPDGLTWQRAFPDLTQALLVAAAKVEDDSTLSECQVWVREGRYPVYQSSSSNTIALSSAVPLYGGFNGSERDPSERVIAAHPSILDGADPQGKNHVYHLIVSTSGGLVDGFTLTGGRADASSGPHANGAGMYVAGGMLRARNLAFVDNAAAGSGGAIYGLNTVLTVDNCRFENNAADGNGGALALEALGSDSTWLTMRSVDLRANRAGGHGGALYTSGAVFLRLENLVVADNVAGGGGGGASLVGTGTLAASTFHANTSGSGASGLVLSCVQGCNVLNSIFWDPSNLPELQLSGSVSVRYNIVNGGAAGSGNSSADPLFVAPSNDLHLRSDSPAIDSADGCAGPERDREGQPRRDIPAVMNSGVAPLFSDRGAYEVQANGSPVLPFSEICRTSSSGGTHVNSDKARSGSSPTGARRPWQQDGDNFSDQ